MRRWFLTFFLIVLCLALFYKDLLSLAVQGIVRWKIGCQIAFREVGYENNQIVLRDVLLVDHSHEHSVFHVQSNKIGFAIHCSQKSISVSITIEEPYVAIFEDIRFPQFLAKKHKSSWFKTDITIENGTFAWHLPLVTPILGRFSFIDKKMEMTIGDGVMTAQWIRSGHERKIDCNFHELEIKPFSHVLSPIECSGLLSGSLVIDEFPLQVSGRAIKIKNFTFFSSEGLGEGGAQLFEWDGEYSFQERNYQSFLDSILSFPYRMKIQFHDGFLKRNENSLEHLNGVFSSNPGVGFRWEINGFNFLWEGKGFSKSLSKNWLKSRWHINETKAFLEAILVDPNHSHWSIECEKIDPVVFRLVQDFWSNHWPCLLEQGIVSAQLSWDEKNQTFENWNLQQFSAKDLVLQADEWDFQADELQANIACGSDVTKSNIQIALSNGNVHYQKVDLTKFSAHCQIQDGTISQMVFFGKLNGLDFNGDWQGSVVNSIAKIQVKGFSNDSELSHSQLNNEFDCSGTTTVSMCLNDNELQIDGSISDLHIKTEAGTIGIQELGQTETYDSGIKAIWNIESGQWIAKSSKAFYECSFHQVKIPLFAEWELRGHLYDDWSAIINLSNVHCGVLNDAKATVIANLNEGLVECLEFEANLNVGNAFFPVRLKELRKHGEKWLFDCFLEYRFFDLARLTGFVVWQNQNLVFDIDSTKSHLLNSPIDVKDFSMDLNGKIESLNASYHLKYHQLLAAAFAIKEINPSIYSLLNTPIEGAVQLDVRFSLNHFSTIRCQGENIRWKNKEIPLVMIINQHQEGWEVERLQMNALDMSCLMKKDDHNWKIQNGIFKWRDSLIANVNGSIDSNGKCELNIDQMSIDLNKTIAPFIWEKLEGKLEGKGFLSLEWNKKLIAEANLDLSAINMMSNDLLIDNNGPMKVYFSHEKGLLIHGLDLQVHKNEMDWPFIHARIGIMEFDFNRNHWILHHAQLKIPTDSLAAVRQKLGVNHAIGSLLQSLDSAHDLEFIADIDSTTDLSSLACSMKEGFIPLWGAVRHVQNVNLNWDSKKMSVSLSALLAGHPVKMGAQMEFLPHPWGTIYLEDEENINKERPLTIDWEMEPNNGWTIHSIEGTFGGIEASFHEQSISQLIGSARIHFGQLSEILPPRLGDVFRNLKMGKGYELKGRLFYDHEKLNELAFKGLLSGKQCELLGFQLRTLLAQVEIDPVRVHFFELKASDSAGILQIDDLKMNRGMDLRWNISMPMFKLLEFRPSLLQKIGQELRHVGPLVVRELKLQDLKGTLDDQETWKAKGHLSFVNSFKREHTVFDLPSDFFGRIFGLDAELMIPVQGTLKYEIKEGRIWLTDLQDAYSEGKRSKFFLVKEGLSPSVDFMGNLHIFITMKQYVLFKITENFLLTLDGSIDNPSYHLQKKSKILGL